MRAHPSTDIRQGMWVTYGDRVAIAAQLLVYRGDGRYDPVGRDDVVTHIDAHIVDENGETTLTTLVPVEAVEQAALSAIPEARRPDAATAEKFGYQ